MKLLTVFLAILFNYSSLLACSCFYVDEFCCGTDSLDNIALVVFSDVENSSVGIFTVIEEVNGALPDTIVALGQDGLNCNFDFIAFDIGDTVLVSFDAYPGGSVSAVDLNTYYWGVYGCKRRTLEYSGGKLYGNLDAENFEIDYDEFKTSLEDCFDFTLNSTETIQQEISLFPNPSNSIFNISIPDVEISDVVVYNLEGQVVQDPIPPSSNNFELDLSAQENGIYFILVDTSAGTLRKKLIKI